MTAPRYMVGSRRSNDGLYPLYRIDPPQGSGSKERYTLIDAFANRARAVRFAAVLRQGAAVAAEADALAEAAQP